MAAQKKNYNKKAVKIDDLSFSAEESSRSKKLTEPVFWLGVESSKRVVLFPIRINSKKQTFRLAISSTGSPTPTPSPTPTKPTVLGGSGQKKQTITDEGDVNDDTPKQPPPK